MYRNYGRPYESPLGGGGELDLNIHGKHVFLIILDLSSVLEHR